MRPLVPNWKVVVWAFALAWTTSATHGQVELPTMGRWDTVAVFGPSGALLNNPWTGGLTAPQFSSADLDGDGVQDLFVFDRDGHRILPFQGCAQDIPESPLLYLYRPDWRAQFPSEMRNWALLRDANCDGVPDVFHNSQSGFRMWLGQFEDGLVHYPDAPTSNVLGNWNFGSGDQLLPLICLNTDIPALDDFDGDGDLDMVTWTETSSTLYAYTGRGADVGSIGCGDTLVFDVTNRCYGMLDEASEDNNLFIGEAHTCGFNVDEPRWTPSGELASPMRHAGGTTALLELDGDGHLDLLLGDISYNSLTACYMAEAEDGQDSTTSTTDVWPADLGGVALDLQRFPAAFPLDVDQDGVRDLLLAPNATFEVDGRKGAWWYRNTGTDEVPVWTLDNRAFLQEGMIDVGRGAYPAFTDFDNDGRVDMVVACKERYLGPGNTPSLLARFKNVGTASAPAFEQLDTNWLSLPDFSLESVSPTFADLDGDGDEDLLLGDELGNLHLWTHTTDSGDPSSFTLTDPALADSEGNAIDVGQFATPCLHDFDSDGDLDLLVGEKNGNLNLFENVGSSLAPSFSLVSASAGQIQADNLLGINGFAVPTVLEDGDNTWLVVGNELGRLQVFVLPENALADADEAWIEITDSWQDIQEGEFAAPAFGDLDGDGQLDMALGARNGGITLWRSGGADAIRGCSPLVDGIDDPVLPEIQPWLPSPNPVTAGGWVTVPGTSALLFDAMGRALSALKVQQGKVQLPFGLPAGVYSLQPLPSKATGAPVWRSARRIVVKADR